MYNALNDEIRNLLLSYDFSKSTDPLQPWSSHITSLLSRATPKTSDITLTYGQESLHLHKFLLSSRTPYFSQKLSEAPETTEWKLSHAVPVEASQVVARYLYLGELPRDLVGAHSSASEEDVFKGIDKVCKQLGVEKLWDAVLSLDDRRLARQRYQDEVYRAQAQVEAFFHQNVLGHKMSVETTRVHEVKWKHDNSIFADCLLRADYEGEDDSDDDDSRYGEALIRANVIPIGPAPGGPASNGASKKGRRSAVYPAHKAMLIRSPYFETMFSGGFLEAQDSEHLHIIKIDCVPDVLEIMLAYLYTDKTKIPIDLALELLYISDMLLIDRLKARAAVAISTLGNAFNDVLVDSTQNNQDGSDAQLAQTEPVNIYDVIRAAWDLRIQRLEEFAARYLAYRLEDYIDEPEFAELIQESASRIKKREETDTIELLDDIRYYLSERFRQARLRQDDRVRFDIEWKEWEAATLPPHVLRLTERLGIENVDTEWEDESEIAPALVSASAAGGGGGGEEEGSLDLSFAYRPLKHKKTVADKFVLDPELQMYQGLLGKIDAMLERLKLDA